MEQSRISYQLIKTETGVQRAEGGNGSGKTQSNPTADRPETGKKVSKRQLINKLNYINFQDETIQVNLKHGKFGRLVACPAIPQPCIDDRLRCIWADPGLLRHGIESYRFHNIIITDGPRLLLLKPELIDIDITGIRFRLPDVYFQVVARTRRRHISEGIQVQFIQNSAVFQGMLTDFSTDALQVRIAFSPPQSDSWINSESPVNLLILKDQMPVYSGECRIVQHCGDDKAATFLLEPLNQEIRRFRPKEFRSIRQRLVPSPNFVFRHPLTGKQMDIEILDLSGLGFSVEEDSDKGVLLAGLIIPDVCIRFANSFCLHCKAQVIYRKPVSDETDGFRVKCGLAFLDMDIQGHMKLMALLNQAGNRHAYICNTVDLDALWHFFFETGFIYPQKYAFIQENKAKIKAVYETLYHKTPDIARHFTYQKNGRIAAHLAMIRFYENTWLIHHHAATRNASIKAGLTVLQQVGVFSNESHSLYANHMDYLICYFRPENKFPSRVFGGAARAIKDPSKCSVDAHAYFHARISLDTRAEMPWMWALAKAEAEDMAELEAFYNHISGGLMLKALDLMPDHIDFNGLSDAYAAIDLTRRRHLFALKKNGVLKAIVMVNISDMGLNLSDLTNAITLIVLDAEGLTKAILELVFSLLLAQFKQAEMPVLLFPAAIAGELSLRLDRGYNLWVLNTRYGDPYFRYVNRLLRLI